MEGYCSKSPRRGRKQDRKWTESLKFGERFLMKEVKEQRTRTWQNKPRERVRFQESATASGTGAVDAGCTPTKRDEGARVQGEISSGGTVLSSFVSVSKWNSQTKSSAASRAREAPNSEMCVSNVAFSETTRFPVTRSSVEETMSSTPYSPKQARGTAQSSLILSSQWWMRCTVPCTARFPEMRGERITRAMSACGRTLSDITPPTM